MDSLAVDGDGFEELTVAFEAMAVDMAADAFNDESAQIERGLAQDGVVYGPGGELVQVHTPWAMGLVDEQGVPLV